MFKPIRKKINEIDRNATEALLQSNRRGIDESEPWAPYVQSAVVFGRCRLLEVGPESIARLKEFAMKYYPDEALADEQIARNGRATQMFEITIEHMSGKQVQEK